MELKALRYLVSLEERGSLTAAAAANYVTQPAVSIALAKLSAELGVPLFETHGRRVRLTRAGETVASYARRFAALERELAEEAADLAGLVRGRLAIGTIDAAGAYVLPGVLSSFRALYPGIDVHLEITATRPLIAGLRAGRFDLVVGTMPMDEGHDIEVHAIFRERLLLIAPPTHPLARRRVVEPASLSGQPFISFHEGSVTRRIVEEAFRREGILPRVTMEVTSPEAIRNLVAAGLGLAILPERVVRADVRRGAVAEIRAARLSFERRLGLAVPAGRYLSSTARAFLAVLAEGLEVSLPARMVASEATKGGGAAKTGAAASAGSPREERSGGAGRRRRKGRR